MSFIVRAVRTFGLSVCASMASSPLTVPPPTSARVSGFAVARPFSTTTRNINAFTGR
jgi:hypothetical protein